ncbi:MAG: hypothetical protein K8F91_15910 [Candidatus Obscuribacterales bacterium]|nr:hypothetical protein [Candidatus Obscuribacterales bacterium]
MEAKEEKNKQSLKWILISFVGSFLLSGSVVALTIYAENQQRPGLSDNVWFEMLGVFTNPYLLVAGLVGVVVVGIIRVVIQAGGFSQGGKL